jgi:hypothetical protein
MFAQQLQEATASLIVSVCPHKTVQITLTDFCNITYLGMFINLCQHIPVFVKIKQKKQALFMNSYVYLWYLVIASLYN